jgi:cation diffusion facilitator CzcD-associated flavoprotein CzcO
MTATDIRDVRAIHQSVEIAAQEWLSAWERAVSHRSRSELEDLFEADAGWRDLVALTWNLRQAHDNQAIAELMVAVLDDINPTDFRLDESRPAPTVLDTETGAPVTCEIFFRFTTNGGEADGYAVLAVDSSTLAAKAHTLMTRLVALTDAPPVWPPVGRFDNHHPTTRWSEHRTERHGFDGRDPEVLIVGAGQFGLMTAAHLGRLGVDTLIIDKQPRIGDAWRSRYEALFLHQPHNILHFSLMPFPISFPEYLPKDKMADWFETYASSFDLNIWAGTEFLGGSYDEEAGTWTVSVRRDDGTERTLHPKHVCMATGGSGIPNVPDLPGLDEFSGTKLHASQFRDGRDFNGQNVLVVGCGTSAHDFALDVVKGGGTATLAQRGPLIVIDLPTANTLYGDYNDREVPTELVDMRFLAGGVYHQQRAGFLDFQKFADDADRELHDKLRNAGLEVWTGQDGTGFYYSFLSRSKGGFYINVGASDAIINGDIAVTQLDDVERFDADGLVYTDGRHQAYDAVIFATAHRPLTEALANYFGQAMVDKLGPVWGFGTDGELRNVLKPTPQRGLWILEGSIPMARWHSPLTALLLKADLLGIIPEGFTSPDHPSRNPVNPVAALAPVFAAGVDS